MVGISQYKLDQIDLVVRRKLNNKTNQEIVAECKYLWPGKDWENKHVSYIFGKHKDLPRYNPQGGKFPPWEPIPLPAPTKPRAGKPANPKSRTISPPIRKPIKKSWNNTVLSGTMELPSDSEGFSNELPPNNRHLVNDLNHSSSKLRPESLYSKEIPSRSQMKSISPNRSLGEPNITRFQERLGNETRSSAPQMDDPTTEAIQQTGISGLSGSFTDLLMQPDDMPLPDEPYFGFPDDFDFNHLPDDNVDIPVFGAIDDPPQDGININGFPDFFDDFDLPDTTSGEGLPQDNYGQDFFNFEALASRTTTSDAPIQVNSEYGMSTYLNAPGVTALGEPAPRNYDKAFSNFEAPNIQQKTNYGAQNNTGNNPSNGFSQSDTLTFNDGPVHEKFVLGSPTQSEKYIFTSTPVRKRGVVQQSSVQHMGNQRAQAIPDTLPIGFQNESSKLATRQAHASKASNGQNLPRNDADGHLASMHGQDGRLRTTTSNLQLPIVPPQQSNLSQQTIAVQSSDAIQRPENIDRFRTVNARPTTKIISDGTGENFSINMESIKRRKAQAVSPSPRPYNRKRRIEVQIQRDIRNKRLRENARRLQMLPRRNIDLHNPALAPTYHRNGNYRQDEIESEPLSYAHGDLRDTGYGTDRGYNEFGSQSSFAGFDDNSIYESENGNLPGFNQNNMRHHRDNNGFTGFQNRNSSFSDQNRFADVDNINDSDDLGDIFDYDQNMAANDFRNRRAASNAGFDTEESMPLLARRYENDAETSAMVFRPDHINRQWNGNDRSMLQASRNQPRANRRNWTKNNAEIYRSNRPAIGGMYHQANDTDTYNNRFQQSQLEGPSFHQQRGHKQQTATWQRNTNPRMSFQPRNPNLGAGYNVTSSANVSRDMRQIRPRYIDSRAALRNQQNRENRLDNNTEQLFEGQRPYRFPAGHATQNLDTFGPEGGRHGGVRIKREVNNTGRGLNRLRLNGPQFSSNTRFSTHGGNAGNPNLAPTSRKNSELCDPATNFVPHHSVTDWEPEILFNSELIGPTMHNASARQTRTKNRGLNIDFAKSYSNFEQSEEFQVDPVVKTVANSNIHGPKPHRSLSEAASLNALIEAPGVTNFPAPLRSSADIPDDYQYRARGVEGVGSHERFLTMGDDNDGDYDFEDDIIGDTYALDDMFTVFPTDDDCSHEDLAGMLR